MIEHKLNTKYEILTPFGFKDFSGIRKTTKSEVVDFILSNGKKITASLDHRFIIKEKEILGRDLEVRMFITPYIQIKEINKKTGDFILYDPTDVEDGSLFLADNITSHNCSFLTSGETVFEPEDMAFYEETYEKAPAERRGVDGNLWIWEQPDYSKSYMVVADVARGDSIDYSAFHVLDIESATQVAEYKGKLSPKDFGNVLVGVGTDYNDALLVVENANIGWATIEQILEREYKNLYYSSKSSTDTVESYLNKYENGDLVPGFTMTLKTRPLVIAKMTEYIREKSATIQSKRLLGEMRVFVWKNGKAQAQTGYNDDLIMSFATGLYVRDTALKLRQQGIDLARAQLSSFSNLNNRNAVVYNVGTLQNNPYIVPTINGPEDISWIFK